MSVVSSSIDISSEWQAVSQSLDQPSLFLNSELCAYDTTISVYSMPAPQNSCLVSGHTFGFVHDPSSESS